MTLALLRAASNNLYAVGRTYYTFDVYAKNRGLCPHMKNHPLGGWMFIAKSQKKPKGKEAVAVEYINKRNKNIF